MSPVSKGITPVVATVLLLTISVAATATAYNFIIDTQERVAQGLEEDLTTQELKQQSDISIDFAYNSTGNFTLINLRNSGSISIPINESGMKPLRLYADGRPVESEVGGPGEGWKYGDSDDQAPEERILIDPDETRTINTTVQYPVRGESKAFRFVGPYDSVASKTCYNSGSSC